MKQEVLKTYKNCDLMELDEFGWPEFINIDLPEVLKHFEQYLVYVKGHGWRHREGVKTVRDVENAFLRSYDNSQYLIDTSARKAVLITEYSHDNPTGCTVIIIGLNKDEIHRLDDDIDKQIAFGRVYAERFQKNKKEEK